jgi:hypothetical protein
VRDERGEQDQLIRNLYITLVESGMVLEISSDCTVAGPVEGRPDFILKMPPAAGRQLRKPPDAARISVIGESKSTHKP